jgi:hypothetical protein
MDSGTGLRARAGKPAFLPEYPRGSLLYLLCFACGNSRGGPLALKIAEHILEHGRKT